MKLQQTHSHHDRSPHRMARSISNTWQVSRYNSVYFHQPVHFSSYVPKYILSDNGPDFKNHLMDQLLQHLGIECIFSIPYHPQSNGKSEIFHKYLKPTLKKLCEKDPANWDKYINQVLASYRVASNLPQWKHHFFGLQKRPQLTSTPAPRSHAMIPRRSRIWFTQLGSTLSSPSNCQEDSWWKPL